MLKMQKNINILVLSMIVFAILSLLIQGCGGGGKSGISAVSGTVADINRNVIVDADVWIDNAHQTKSLVSGAFRIQGVQSGWKTVRAQATINGLRWVGSTAAEVLKNEPTVNINIVLAPERDTTSIGGVVRDDTGRRISGARVLITTRELNPPDSSSFDGPYGSIVAVTDEDGRYVIEDAPTGLAATISASKVGFRNDEQNITTITDGLIVNFSMTESNLGFSPEAPILEAIESYTMPDSITRADLNGYEAVRAFTSQRYRAAMANRKQIVTRATPPGSLIEIDLYWNSLDVNDSRDVAGYGIYRTTSPSIEMSAIDFVRDPYANFYGDSGAEITPNQIYYYAVNTVDVQFLDQNNNPDPASDSELSQTLSVRPLGQLASLAPAQGASVTGDPTFSWRLLSGAISYSVYLYDEFPTLPLDPASDYTNDPAGSEGTFPIWPTASRLNDSTVGAGVSSIRYNGSTDLIPGRSYYWVVLAADDSGKAFSYSQIRKFTAR